MKREWRLVIIIALLAIVIVAISVPTFAIWSDGSNVGGEVVVTLFDDITARYLVYDGVTSAGKHYYMTYNDAGYFEGNDSYNKSYQVGGVWYSKYDDEVDLTATAFSYVCAIGYTGSLGKYESLVIPDYITWHDSSDSDHRIYVTKINMQSSAAFPSLKLIKSVVIGANINDIQGSSFSFMPQLEKVYFRMGQSATNTLWTAKSAASFVGNGELTRYYYSDGNYIEI